MQFTPKTEKEIAEENLWQAGIYDFEVSTAIEKKSQNGNDMIVLKLRVFNDEGHARFVEDYLLESMSYKLRHACDACGLLDRYESGSLEAEDFVNKTGKLKLVIQKDKEKIYPDKNGVQDYIKRENLIPEHSVAKGNPYQAQPTELNDDIPF